MPRASLPPSARKPAGCTGCSLHERGHGFVEPDGPSNAPILIMGEAPGYEEAALGRPFVGAAGSMLERIFRRNRLQRGQFRIGNILQCVPPGMLLEGMPYQHTAIQHCAIHRETLLNEGHQVVVAAGATALKTLLNLHGQQKIRVEEFHGTVHRDPDDRFWVVPTFHPSYLQRGAHNLIGTVSFDLQVALELARGTWRRDSIDPVIDPPYDWVESWVSQLEAATAHDPDSVAIASDIETPDKAGGKPENELTPDDDSYQITRYNFACHPDQGLTIPNDPRYLPLIRRILAIPCRHYWWNGYGYDWARIAAAGIPMDPRFQLDLMIAAHVLQSDVPLGLGFWAPFYSTFGAWKHLSATDPELYACLDGPQTLRCGFGIIGDLVKEGQWRAFQEDCHELYYQALKPAQDVGVLIDRPALDRFHEDLATKQRRLLHEMQGCVPEGLRPLTHETSREPEEGVLHPDARTTNLRTGELKKGQPDAIKQDLYALAATRVEREVTRLIQVCHTCGDAEVSKKHRCKDDSGKPDPAATPRVELCERVVTRWFWQEPFNPDSPKQMLAYIKSRGHTPGKNKKTKEDAADRETLIRLCKTTKDPFYQINLDYRAVKKVDSTYAVPTMRRVDKEIEEGKEGRLHPIPTFRPSTMRLSYVQPNITNVVTDKGGKESLAAGFRRCVVAAAGSRLLEVDYSGIEAVETGWFSRDPSYIRLARLGVHAYLASHLHRRPATLSWSDTDLLAYFKEIKAASQPIYDKAKRTVHGCVTGDHEVLTPLGWVRFDRLRNDQAIAVWNPTDRVVHFEVPSRVTRDAHTGPMTTLHGRGFSIHGTPEHRLAVRTGQPKRTYKIATLETLPEGGRLPTAGFLDGTKFFTPALQLAVAIQADGSVTEGGQVRFHLRKVRKIDRLDDILSELDRRFLKTLQADGSTTYWLPVDTVLPALWWLDEDKVFNLHGLMELTVVAKERFLQELLHWDGATTDREPAPKRVRREYITTNYKNAKIVQTIAHLAGMQGLLRTSLRDETRQPLHRVSFNQRTEARVSSLQRVEYAQEETTVYCVTVSTEHFLMRYQDRVIVSANTNYGLTPFGMVNTYPDLYKDVKDAEKVQRTYFDICPGLPVWHSALRQQAYDAGCLGGPGAVLLADDNSCYKSGWKGPSPWPHPFQYRHWFWSVLAYKPINEAQRLRRSKSHKPSAEINGRWFGVDWGEDSKRVIAFYPQSTAAGVLKRSIRALFHPDSPSYIGDAYYGRTPLRAPIHDSLLLEIPDRQWDRVCEAVFREMQRPIVEQPLPLSWGMGSHLMVGVEAKAGKNWGETEGIAVPGIGELGLTEQTHFPIEEEIDGDDLYDLNIVA